MFRLTLERGNEEVAERRMSSLIYTQDAPGGVCFRGRGVCLLLLRAYFFLPFLAVLRGVSSAAWAAAKRATGTRKGLQLT